MKQAYHIILLLKRTRWVIVFLLLGIGTGAIAQPLAQVCKVRDGKMYIEVDKRLDDSTVDNFIARYNLFDLPLKELIKGKLIDSIRRMGWKIENSPSYVLVITKKLSGYDKINNPADRILFAEKKRSIAERFPPVHNSVVYGYNRFRNKNSFAVQDSIVTFFLRNNLKAGKVMLAGSFNNFLPDALAMQRTDSGWIAQVKLGPGKYWYKFIVDGGWTIDRDNLINEPDEEGNVNSVYFKTNWLFSLPSNGSEKKIFVTGSFNKWRPKELQMYRDNNKWILPVYLLEGTHTYRFIADGESFTDPSNPEKLPNETNEFNSVIQLGVPYLFHLSGYLNANKIILAGSFNGWRMNELYMRKTGDGWELPYTLGPGNYEYKFIVDGKTVIDPDNAFIQNIKGHSGNSFFILKPNYTFRLKGFGKAQTVFLAGDFNNWSPNTFVMQKEGDEWVLKVNLLPGKHLYKFVVDGNWIIDPANKQWEQNEYSTGNSVLWFRP